MYKQFFTDLERGKQAEVLVAKAFVGMGYSVFDVSEDSSYWGQDIDLIIYDRNSQEHYFEIKADWNMYKTGNVVLELTSQTGSDGWYRTSEATHFAFCDMINRICYIARAAELHEYTEHTDLPHVKLNNCECILLNVYDCQLFQKIRI